MWVSTVSTVSCHFQLKNWESLPNDKPIISAYSRTSGQELFFVNIKKDLLEYIKAVRINGQRHCWSIKDTWCLDASYKMLSCDFACRLLVLLHLKEPLCGLPLSNWKEDFHGIGRSLCWLLRLVCCKLPPWVCQWRLPNIIKHSPGSPLTVRNKTL